MLDVHTLTDGGQTVDAMAARVVSWLAGARESLDLALYDVRLPGAPGDAVADAIRAAHARGVRVRIAFNQDERPPDDGPRPPPPRTEPHVLETLGVPVKPIPGWRDLMHHKYVVRDGARSGRGSMNWTLDSWTRQENAIAHARFAAGRGGLRAQLRAALGARAVERQPATSTSRPVRRRPARRGSAPAAGRSSRTGSRSGSARRGAACGSPRRC